MIWLDELARNAVAPFAINDSKTPSGRAHVGALRGVLIHDSIYRHLSRLDARTTYTFGCDDYDALDELPYGLEDFYRPYLGIPLCNVPPPPNAKASDLADYNISEFFDLFKKLDVSAKTYRMRDLYRSGEMDEVIDTILRHRDLVREIYRRVNGSVKPESWHPFQVICPRCGKIGSTIVTDYDGKLVQFRCEEKLVSWAVGCGHAGWVSPFGGGGKLPWKVEWAARWKVLGVTIEGAGKDHSTRGGSRDVADAISRDVLGYNPPLNQPYEFFLVAGSKMSSSKGIGASAVEISDLLQPQLLRFLLIRTPARKALNFTPDLESITRLYSDYDRMLAAVESDNPTTTALEIRQLTRIAGAGEETARIGKLVPWDTIVSLVQMPHVDFWGQVEGRFDPGLSNAERMQLRQRVESAIFWLDNYAGPEERIRLTGGDSVLDELSNTQRAFLSVAGKLLVDAPWTSEAVQAALFDAARLTPIGQAEAFSALYMLLLGRPSGPKAGSFLAFLAKEDTIARLTTVTYSHRLLIEETVLGAEGVLEALRARREEINFVEMSCDVESVAVDGQGDDSSYSGGLAIAELLVVCKRGRKEVMRAYLGRFKGYGSTLDDEREVVRDLLQAFSRDVRRIVPVRV